MGFGFQDDDGICFLPLSRLTPAPFRDFLLLTRSVHCRVLDNEGIVVLVGQECRSYLTGMSFSSRPDAESLTMELLLLSIGPRPESTTIALMMLRRVVLCMILDTAESPLPFVPVADSSTMTMMAF